MGKKKPFLLIILDGFGLREEREYNAVKLAATPCLDRLWAEYPHTRLTASGTEVGLPDGQMGNSEVGHLNIGSGRIVYQELTRISKAIKDGVFFENKVLLSALRQVKEKKSALHLIGLLSDGGVHSHIEHLFALLKMAKKEGAAKVYVHALLDGRDTPPRSGLSFVERLESEIKTTGVGEIATVAGRYYAMDRDNRWERVERAYRTLALGEGERAKSAVSGVKASYAAGLTDEFGLPFCGAASSFGGMKAEDGVIFYNFRADRAREITHAIALANFTASSTQPLRIPTQIALIPARPTSPMASIPIFAPPPSFPRSASSGSFTSVRTKSPVTEPRSPSLCSLRPGSKPFVPFSMMKAESLFRPFSSTPVLAVRTVTSAI